MVKQAKKSKNNGLDKQIFWFLLVIFLCLTFIIMAPYVYHQLFNKFQYAGVNFEKIKDKQLTFYHGISPIIVQGKFYHNYNMYFRVDPRKNEVPINTTIGLSRNISISYEEEAFVCRSAILGQSLLGQFFYAFPWVKNVNTALIDPVLAKSENLTYINCNNATLDHTVFIVKTSENTSIQSGEQDNCYILNVGNCQNIEVAERLVIATIAQTNNITL